uniref:Uncharacterized protein n=1 Tax=Mucochytrium quahogii TaxID=96639 RepID=A0A7S2W6M9_9STRA|mmetsp:Transcript_35416/g.56621  ORF Transcript_35416/g.56621 Transcript_35416/m.56621 type:complete len:550 (+) Transcript_35416:123-1772(+)|eukprot:CAMPEP_0203757946 /NCGR_PEP_ID=MMETSP0098-20131031/10773_1 /ASSEMBLY_ACC=CAM_ASM_000208 /TAXON_ID=96639 /ORGANISM=" , Strain NY0313808BC1" /LENGTH=549 /DNA_ID=CAMNT_0050650191 /DNA_START=86 /DNA_END=1735 /DNA_ORIENTATION=+
MANVWDDDAHGDREEYGKGGVAVGIDLGTTNSCVSVWVEDKARAKTIKCAESGRKTFRSVVLLDAENKLVAIGDKAVEMYVGHDGNVLVGSSKRFIGRRFSSVTKEEMDMFPFKIMESQSKKDQIVISNPASSSKGVEPELIACAILLKLKHIAEEYLERQVDKAVITVPAFFTERQKAATKRAGEMAKLKVLRLLTEPMAAAMSYGLFVAGKKTSMVVDMGGGTFDVSVLRIDNGKFEALVLGGDNKLGGDSVDHILMQYAASTLDKTIETMSPRDKSSLKDDCEQAKISLSTQDHAWIQDGLTINLEQFEKLVEPLKQRTVEIIQHVLGDTKGIVIDEVILVGLSTKMPWLRRTLLELVPSCKELCTNVQADRAVSQGAAIQAAILSGVDRYTLSKVLMLDALPYSVGLEAGDGKFVPMLNRNSKMPCSESKIFTTHRDYQRAITIDIFEGEDPIARTNRWVDYRDFVVEQGSKLKAGEASIMVTFTVTENGTLKVEAETVKSKGNEHTHEEEIPNMSFLVTALVLLVAIFIYAKTTFAEQLRFEQV